MDRRLDSQSKPGKNEADAADARSDELDEEVFEVEVDAEDIEEGDEEMCDEESCEEIAAQNPPRPHLITADMLRAAGALDVPPGWRTSLGPTKIERDLFSDLVDD